MKESNFRGEKWERAQTCFEPSLNLLNSGDICVSPLNTHLPVFSLARENLTSFVKGYGNRGVFLVVAWGLEV